MTASFFPKNEHDHFCHVKEVCQRLRKSSLMLKAGKCRFFCKSLEYLGHTLSGEGVVPKKSLVGTIVNTPSPDNRGKLLSFAGLCEYYSKFIKNFATKMEPLKRVNQEVHQIFFGLISRKLPLRKLKMKL